MAIKNRKRRNDDNSPEENGSGDNQQPEGGGEPDAFIQASMQTASWFEQNKSAVIGGAVALVVAAIGIIFAMDYTNSMRVEASSSLSEALAAYEVPVEGSPDLQAMRQQEERQDIKAPEQTYDSAEQRWQDVYDRAGDTLDNHGSSQVAQQARLVRASAAYHLDNYEESANLYEEYLDGSHQETIEPFVYYGLANAYSAQGQVDQAIETLDRLAQAGDTYASLAKYHKASVYENAGQTEQARELYVEILESDSQTPFKTNIERRLALLGGDADAANSEDAPQ